MAFLVLLIYFPAPNHLTTVKKTLKQSEQSVQRQQKTDSLEPRHLCPSYVAIVKLDKILA